jgi:hypothetical protein
MEAVLILITALLFIGLTVSIPVLSFFALRRTVSVIRKTRFSLQTLMFFVLFGGTCAALLVNTQHELCVGYGVLGTIVFVSLLISHIITGNEAYEPPAPDLTDEIDSSLH